MKVTLESTTKIVQIDGVSARVYEGRSERGIEIYAFVTLMAPRSEQDRTRFLTELHRHRVPSEDVAELPFRQTLS